MATLPAPAGRQGRVSAERVGPGATILVVEERRRDRNHLVGLLAEQGYVVFEASDARAALDLIDRQQPNLVISSANARPIGGAELVRRLRQRPNLEHTPVAFYAGAQNEKRARAAGARLGIREILTNGTSPDAVLRTVRALLAEGLASRTHTTVVAGGASAPSPPRAHPTLTVDGAVGRAGVQIVVGVSTASDLVRVGAVAPVLVACLAALRANIGAERAAVGFTDNHDGQARAAILLDGGGSSSPSTVMSLGDGFLCDMLARRTVRWSGAAGDGSSPLVADDQSAWGTVIGTPLVSGESVWGWLVIGRRAGEPPFGDREERLATLIVAHACAMVVRLQGGDGQQAHDTVPPMRELQTVCVNELDALGSWEVDGRLDAFTASDSLIALLGRDEVTSLRRCAALVDLVHADDRERVIEAFRRANAEGTGLDIECRWLLAEGVERTLHLTGGRRAEAPGRSRGLFGIAADVTERRRLEGRLLQAQRTSAIGLLAASVAHDFNNVLTAILGQARLLADDLSDPRHRREMEQIHRSAERGTELTRQLLMFSRTQSPTDTILGLNDVIEEVTSMLRRLLGAHVELHSDLDADAPAVRVDRTQLEQLILNLVMNARDAMPDGGRIDVRTKRASLLGEERFRGEAPVAGVYALLTVTDTGTGIDERVKARMFDPFFTTKARGEGTGLGLATVSTIVKRYGGYLDVRSALGAGSVFHVYLPAVERRVATEALPPTAEEADEHGTRVLVVEDEPEVRNLVGSVLKRAGYEVVEAADTQEAEALIARLAGNIDLVIADVLIPGGTGPELFRRLSAVRPTIRAIFMSGYPDDALAGTVALDPGAAFVQKPFTIDGLLQTIRTVLHRPPRG